MKNKLGFLFRKLFWDRTLVSMVEHLKSNPQLDWIFVLEIVPLPHRYTARGIWWFSRSANSYQCWGEITHFFEVNGSDLIEREYSDFIERRSIISRQDNFYKLLDERDFWGLSDYYGGSRDGIIYKMRFLSSNRMKSLGIWNPHRGKNGKRYQEIIKVIVDFWENNGFECRQSWNKALQKHMAN